MKLKELLADIPGIAALPEHPNLETEVTGLSTNSHACKVGDLFIGMPGTRVDGGEFWEGAIASGAIAALISPQAAVKSPPKENLCLFQGENIPLACAKIAAKFYNNPTQHLQAIGVTGTNGKTTTTHLIEFFLSRTQSPTALFGTLYARWPGYEKTASYTTPFAIDLQGQLAAAADAGSQYAVMEVSSHALEQGRVKECVFEVGAFTNLTQDHLDYHPTMEDYFEAKALLFAEEYLKGRGIINFDDPYGKRLIDRLPSDRVWSYSIKDANADLWLRDLAYEADGVRGTLHTPKGEIAFQSPLVGQFNLANLLAAVGTVLHLGIELEQIIPHLSDFSGVPGRMERVQIDPQQDIGVIVDYAHTPDSLENMLKAARPFILGRVICVFGCGGDRDRTKRPKMGKIAAELADLAVVTSDNPRTENPEQILQDILEGIPSDIEPIVEGDRSRAIRKAILEAKPGDGILIAGKGHEDYQILGTEKIHFDDREQAREALKLRFKK
ncbi:MAG: UDP-N-acetylmuramoyl-L-alanyl-D-glutamate--2,6-diaminopimelate ligase [Cyanobacteria bacterium SBLK]|nr:UDP-N-acetylmuramoyl-L-alanyl-D-glutamate--2,6-diaminopimelate ligase [Cyanobacteria bacterium SBLK]